MDDFIIKLIYPNLFNKTILIKVKNNYTGDLLKFNVSTECNVKKNCCNDNH